MNGLPRSSISFRFWLPCVMACLLTDHGVTSQETIAESQAIKKNDEKTFESWLNTFGELRSRNMDRFVKASKEWFGPTLDKDRSVPGIGYFVWEDLFENYHYYDGKLIRLDCFLEGDNSADALVGSIEKKYGKSIDGVKHESMKPFEQLKTGKNSLNFTVKRSFYWEARSNYTSTGEKPIEIPVTIEITQIDMPETRAVKRNGKVEVTPGGECLFLSISDSEQLGKLVKALERK